MDNLELRTERAPRRRASARMPAPVTSPAALPLFTPELAAEMAPLYARVKHIITPMEWPHYAPLIKAINELKEERNAVILAHNYMTPEIFHCVGDFRGDSLQLAKEAARTTAQVIVQAGVHFMAETSKLLNARQDRAHPGFARWLLARGVDHACRRAHAARGLSGRSDRHLRQHFRRREGRVRYLLHLLQRREGRREPRRAARPAASPTSTWRSTCRRKTKVEIIAWKGHCEVHERFTGEGHRATSARPIPAARSSRIPSARPRSSRPPTSPARRRR